MTQPPLGRALAAGVGAVAVLGAVAGLAYPMPDRAPGWPTVALSFGLLATHALLYWFGRGLRERRGLPWYVGGQAAVLFAIALAPVPGPVAVAVLIAATVELIVLAGPRWGTVRITLGAIVLYTVASLPTRDLYRAASAGMLLALTGVLAHAVAGLLRASPLPAPEGTASVEDRSATGGFDLSSREVEVLRALAAGARNREIAATLGIAERTVKAHLGSIYRKLGVETRAAAVAAAVQQKLV